jgi:hypothetical protein
MAGEWFASSQHREDNRNFRAAISAGALTATVIGIWPTIAGKGVFKLSVETPPTVNQFGSGTCQVCKCNAWNC